MISASLAPAFSAPSVWPRMQYGHCVVCATATAINCLVLAGSAPSAKHAALNARNASSCFGATGTPLASRDVPGERGRLSSCIWNLGFFPNHARKNCPFVLTSFAGWSSERCPGIGFLSRGDREIGVLRNVEPPTRPRLECLRETGLILRCDRKVGNPFQTKQGSRPS